MPTTLAMFCALCFPNSVDQLSPVYPIRALPLTATQGVIFPAASRRRTSMIRQDGDFVPVLYDTKTGTVVAGLVPVEPEIGSMRFARLFAACCAVLCVAVGSPARAQESYPTFLGATLGQPAQDLRATLGDPLQVTTTTDAGIKAGLPAQRWARFWIPPGNA